MTLKEKYDAYIKAKQDFEESLYWRADELASDVTPASGQTLLMAVRAKLGKEIDSYEVTKGQLDSVLSSAINEEQYVLRDGRVIGSTVF